MLLKSVLGTALIAILASCGGEVEGEDPAVEGEEVVFGKDDQMAVSGVSYLKLSEVGSRRHPWGNRKQAHGVAYFNCGWGCKPKFRLKICLDYRSIGDDYYRNTCRSTFWYKTKQTLKRSVSRWCTPADEQEYRVSAYAEHDSGRFFMSRASGWFRCR